jgi:archaemetzincin
MILTIKPFGNVDRGILESLSKELSTWGDVSVGSAEPVPESFDRRIRDGQTQYLASDFERAMSREPGDRVLGVTNVDLYERGLNFVFGHATIRDRFAVVSVARFGNDGPDRLLERSAKTAIHELGHTFGLYHDDANSDCVMHFSEKLEDTDRKSRSFCTKCNAVAKFTLSRLQK